MNITRIVKIVPALVLAVAGWTMTGCSPPPVEQGYADLQALGVGVARALSPFLKEGDQVVVFTTPGALGAGAEAERATVIGLTSALKPHGIVVTAVQYSPDEIQAYHQSYATDLRESFARGAFERAGGPNAQAFVSLAGWPDSAWLPAETVLAAVDWDPYAATPVWKEYRAIIQAVSRDERTGVPPGTALHKKLAEAIAWFDQRFDVEVKTR